MKNNDKFHLYRQEFEHLTFHSFDYSTSKDHLKIIFNFSIDDLIYFSPKTEFLCDIKNSNTDELNSLIFHLGMAELVSYWKAVCPKKITVNAFQLNSEQLLWWKTLYFNGLGEFFYVNDIQTDFSDFVSIKSISEKPFKKVEHPLNDDSVIVPVGGGKDSVVSLEFFKSTGRTVYPMLVNPRKAMLDCVEIAEIDKARHLVINRTIAPELLELNKAGYLNGHTPFSSVLAFQSLILSYLTGIQYIALSNESSANEPTVADTDINHQYSKSYRFEKDFREYASKFLFPDSAYFSVLRPLSELQIAAVFAKQPQYFSAFRSCNAGSKNDLWCCNCPKCLFTAIILHPFLTPDEIYEIFGTSIFDNIGLLDIFKQLTGLSSVKPFECVGTTDEVRLALNYCIQEQYKNKKLPLLLSFFTSTHLFQKIEQSDFQTNLLTVFDNNHFLEQNLYEQLLAFLRQTLRKA